MDSAKLFKKSANESVTRVVKFFTNIRIFLHQHPKLIRQHASPTYMKISVFTNMRILFTNIPDILEQHTFFHQNISPTSFYSHQFWPEKFNSKPECVGVSQCDNHSAFSRTERAFRRRFVGLTWAFTHNKGSHVITVHSHRICGQNGCLHIWDSLYLFRFQSSQFMW